MKFKGLIYLLGPTLLLFIFNLTYFNKYFPLSEGWWITYGYLLNGGLQIYKDFNVPTSPLFVYLHLLFLKYIGNQYIILRFIGVVFNALLFFLSQLFLEYFFPRKIAAIVTIVVSFLYISSPVFSAHDYHTLVDLFVILSLLLSCQAIKNRDANKQYICIFLIGVVVALLLLTKQNVGIFLFLSYLLCLPIVSSFRPLETIRKVICICTGFLATILMFCHATRINFIELFTNLFLKSDSKGDASTVLLRFLISPQNRRIIALSIAFFILYLLFYRTLWKSFHFDKILPRQRQNNMKPFQSLLSFMSMAGLFALVFLFFLSSYFQRVCYFMIIPISISIVCFALWHSFKSGLAGEKSLMIVMISIPLLAIVYTNTQTAAPALWGMPLVVGLSFCYIVEQLIAVSFVKPTILYMLLLCLVPPVIANKYSNPYLWWGAKQSSILEAKYELSYPSLKGLYVDKITYLAIEKIRSAIEKYSTAERDVYLFPNIPIFYSLHHKLPPYKNIGQWFDFISSEEISRELENFRRNPPRLIIFFDPPKYVYDGHYTMIKRKLLQEEFKKEFDDLVKKGFYEQIEYFVYDQKTLDEYPESEEFVPREIVCNNPDFIEGRSLSEISNAGDDIIIDELRRKGIKVDLTGAPKLLQGDRLEVRIRKKALGIIVGKLGYIEKENKYYILKIYKKK